MFRIREIFQCQICKRFFLAGTWIHFEDYHLTEEQKPFWRPNYKYHSYDKWRKVESYVKHSEIMKQIDDNSKKIRVNISDELFTKMRESSTLIYLVESNGKLIPEFSMR